MPDQDECDVDGCTGEVSGEITHKNNGEVMYDKSLCGYHSARALSQLDLSDPDPDIDLDDGGSKDMAICRIDGCFDDAAYHGNCETDTYGVSGLVCNDCFIEQDAETLRRVGRE